MSTPSSSATEARSLIPAWDFLTVLTSIVAILTAGVISIYRFDDYKEATLFLATVTMGIVLVLLTTVLARLAAANHQRYQPNAAGTGD